eukprot:CAMPEP_0174271262 /NCGR_PEP_ID=MMETSP0439-20130205/47277_1 /TAXON_ID=0 /ORGANISM="Stereomyxa ramosa, Strain Chinc5" /LENGTH=119 /DNA_ID=CAMNT_0015361145 /DNA_START=150 /DNA_END=506 /DNA_ORIENTATION=+
MKKEHYTRLAGGPESPVSVIETKEKGRAIIANSNIEKDQLITAEKPFATYSAEKCNAIFFDEEETGKPDTNTTNNNSNSADIITGFKLPKRKASFYPTRCDHCFSLLSKTSHLGEIKYE